MEFIKISGQVKEITIPEGECKKIVEAATGRILWEKKLGPLTENSGHWELVNFPTNQICGSNFVDYDIASKNVMFLAHGSNTINEVSYHNYWSFLYDGKSNKFSDFYRYYCNLETVSSDDEGNEDDGGEDDLTEPHYTTYLGYPVAHHAKIMPVDIDPVSKTIITYGIKSGKSDLNKCLCVKFADDEHLRTYAPGIFSHYLHRVCWMPEKELFLLLMGYSYTPGGETSTLYNDLDTILMDTSGNVVNAVKNNKTLFMRQYFLNIPLCYAGDKGIILYPNATSYVKKENGVWLSSNGLNWERSFIFPDNWYFRNICYCSGTGTFLATCEGEDRYVLHIYKSTDGRNWDITKTFENMETTSSAGGNSANSVAKVTWSSKKNIACLGCYDRSKDKKCLTSYISRDFENWVEIPIKPTVQITGSAKGSGVLKWSDALNAFIWLFPEEGYFLKLIIDD